MFIYFGHFFHLYARINLLHKFVKLLTKSYLLKCTLQDRITYSEHPKHSEPQIHTNRFTYAYTQRSNCSLKGNVGN